MEKKNKKKKRTCNTINLIKDDRKLSTEEMIEKMREFNFPKKARERAMK